MTAMPPAKTAPPDETATDQTPPDEAATDAPPAATSDDDRLAALEELVRAQQAEIARLSVHAPKPEPAPVDPPVAVVPAPAASTGVYAPAVDPQDRVGTKLVHLAAGGVESIQFSDGCVYAVDEDGVLTTLVEVVEQPTADAA